MTLPTRRLVVAALALAPAACSLLGGGTVTKLYTLTPVKDFPPAQSKLRVQMLVEVPEASEAFKTRQIALRRNTLSFDYFADSNWTDSAPYMIQTLLVESFENSGRVTAVARETMALQGTLILRPELRHFEADYGDNEPVPTVRVELGLILVHMPDRAIAGTHTAAATAKPTENQTPAIVAAFDLALRDAMRDAVAWTLATGAKAQ